MQLENHMVVGAQAQIDQAEDDAAAHDAALEQAQRELLTEFLQAVEGGNHLTRLQTPGYGDGSTSALGDEFDGPGAADLIALLAACLRSHDPSCRLLASAIAAKAAEAYAEIHADAVAVDVLADIDDALSEVAS